MKAQFSFRTPPIWLQLAIVMVASRIVLELIVAPPPLHPDTARDLLLARDCIERGRCATEGARSSFLGLVQGDVWLRFLEAVGTPARARSTALTLHALSAGALWLVPRRLCAWPTAIATTVLYLALSVWTIEYPVLWNPSLVPLVAAVFAVSLVATAADGEIGPSVASGTALALSADLHVATLALVPVWLAALSATTRRPWIALPVAVLALLGTYMVASPGAAAENLSILGHAATTVALACVGAIALGIGLRRIASRRTRATRARFVVFGIAASALVVAVLAKTLSGHPVAPRYLAPVAPFMALAAAAAVTAVAALGRWRDWQRHPVAGGVVAIVVCLLGAYVWMPRHDGAATAWSWEDLAPIVGALRANGFEYPDVVRHVRGPDTRDLVEALGAVLPASPAGPPAIAPMDDLLLIRVAAREIPSPPPPGWQLVTLGRESAVLIRRARSMLDLDDVEVCAGDSRTASMRCARVDLEARDASDRPDAPLAARAYREFAALRAVVRGTPQRQASRMRVAFHMRQMPDGVARIVDAGPGWTVEAIDGAVAHSHVPARCVRLHPSVARASITFETRASGGIATRLPPYIETSASETQLRSLLERRSDGPCTPED